MCLYKKKSKSLYKLFNFDSLALNSFQFVPQTIIDFDYR